MTKIKTISIPDNEDCFDRLNELTPNDMNFSEQVRYAVFEFLKFNEEKIIREITQQMPNYDSPIEDWISYIKAHPEQTNTLIRKHVKIGNILKGDTIAIRK